MRLHRFTFPLAAIIAVFTLAQAAHANVMIIIDKSTQTMTVTVNAIAPCKTTTLTWYVMAMSGSNYTGTTFALDTTKSTKTTKVNGTCTLSFWASLKRRRRGALTDSSMR